jgi:MFS family permease
VAIFAAIVCFCAYTSIFCFRKAFNVAPYAGYQLFGIDFKILLVITQVAGYMLSKFYGIKFISELKRIGRGRLILLLVGVSWLAWLLFALLPPPYNFWCLFFNGFPLGMLWGVIFSYVEGRRTTDFISAALAVSFIFASGLAKSTALYVMEAWGVNEYWMPFVTGLIFMLPLLVFVYLLERIPPPDKEDILHRTERLPMPKEKRREFLLAFWPGIVVLVIIYILVTILREVRDGFMADMWRESGEAYESGIFAQTETIISLVILVMVAVMVIVKNNFRAFMLSQGIMFIGFVIAGVSTFFYLRGQVSMFNWMTLVGLGLYMVYIPYNSLLFERFIASFRYAGNVGFLIYIADSFGYLGSVGVLLSKTIFKVNVQWLEFYTGLVMIAAVIGVAGTLLSVIYFKRKYAVSGGGLRESQQNAAPVLTNK